MHFEIYSCWSSNLSQYSTFSFQVRPIWGAYTEKDIPYRFPIITLIFISLSSYLFVCQFSFHQYTDAVYSFSEPQLYQNLYFWSLEFFLQCSEWVKHKKFILLLSRENAGSTMIIFPSKKIFPVWKSIILMEGTQNIVGSLLNSEFLFISTYHTIPDELNNLSLPYHRKQPKKLFVAI